MTSEPIDRIEPCRLDEPGEEVADVIADLSAAATMLGRRLHPRTAASLADVVRIMNTYYSNLIEGHDTHPRDIERALAAQFEAEGGRRNLQLEALAHMRVQKEIETRCAAGELAEPASVTFIRWLHFDFYKDAAPEALRIQGADHEFQMAPGEFRSLPEHDVAVGRRLPPSSHRVPDFMEHFEQRYRFDGMGTASRIMAMAAAHHRPNYIHPFPDGNGRVSRLMSHAMGACRPALARTACGRCHAGWPAAWPAGASTKPRWITPTRRARATWTVAAICRAMPCVTSCCGSCASASTRSPI